MSATLTMKWLYCTKRPWPILLLCKKKKDAYVEYLKWYKSFNHGHGHGHGYGHGYDKKDGYFVPVEMMMMEQEMVKPNLVTEDGQQVLIIIAPSSPVDSDQAPVSPVSSDPDWSPSPVSPGSLVEETSAAKPRKKYARSKPPKAPVGPYPTDKKERKKAQNRTAAFRYREKMKSQQDMV